MQLVKETKLENEVLRQKVDVLKQEFYKLESTSRQGGSETKAELAVCKERLANYEMIEKELDNAIMNVANGEEANEVGSALVSTITSAPTTAKRRIQQSLLLANRLQAKQKELEGVQAELKELKDKCEAMEGHAKLQKRLMDKTNQPYSYMIKDVEKAEKELFHATKKIKQQEEIIMKVKRDNESLKIQKKGLDSDL
jgi:progesterone-induced-blocking factor 1